MTPCGERSWQQELREAGARSLAKWRLEGSGTTMVRASTFNVNYVLLLNQEGASRSQQQQSQLVMASYGAVMFGEARHPAHNHAYLWYDHWALGRAACVTRASHARPLPPPFFNRKEARIRLVFFQSTS